MACPIEDYAMIGDCETAALVSRWGSVDWLCLPRFDSGACFAALLGTPEHGRWRIAPVGLRSAGRRRYRGDTLVLETELDSDEGTVALIDFMPPGQAATDLVRIVEGRRGTVSMEMDLRIRFDYGATIPWVRRNGSDLLAIAGPNTLRLRSPVPTVGEGRSTMARFRVAEGQRLAFDLTWHPSYQDGPGKVDPIAALVGTERFWLDWASRCRFEGRWRDAVVRSLITLKALTYRPTGGIVAAPTTSLPERFGGVRNWDYRYCWIRDATFVIYALVESGYLDEAYAFREWLLRAAAGAPEQMRIMYGVAGERFMPEHELRWLPGYEGSRPVRLGNAANEQLQLDVYGELLDAMHASALAGLPRGAHEWALERAILDFLETGWREPDEGIWEIRAERRHFVHSKVMAWVAFDRAIKAVERFGLPGPLDRWRALRASIHDEVCRRGYDQQKRTFVQSYDCEDIDASLLTIPLVGFLPSHDPRVVGTMHAVERELMEHGFVRRYLTHLRDGDTVDGLPPGEGTFLLCSFWLVDNLELAGRHADADQLFERVLAVRNDVGLLAEGYDAQHGRMVGNFPQAFSHLGLVNSARNLSQRLRPADERRAS